MALAWKRPLDLIGGGVGLVASVPLIAIVATLVLITSGRPVFLVQTRVGAAEQPLRVIKFRTMRVGVPVVAKSELERRREMYTPLGPWLRRVSLDELPQLINVVRGDMSLVGPRPALPSQHSLLSLRRKYGITAQKPGITGLAQILGRENMSLATKVRAETVYVHRASLALDLRILLLTVRAVLFGRGAY